MSCKLSDIERTLLSAYLDGEISVDEKVQAEQLLARSEGARAYLNEIRSVHILSGSALAAPSVIVGSGTSLAAKLSGSAIETAAEKAVYAKAVSIGFWSLAGVVSAATAVVIGVALSVSAPSSPVVATKVPVPAAGDVQEATTPAVIAEPRPATDLDTTNLLVPPMTPSDLFAFAVNGTLPIDAKRGRYITVAPKGSDSIALEVHAKAPENLSEQLPSFSGTALAIFDSIQWVVRTSLLQYSNERLALRADLQALRLGVIRSFEQAAPHMPVQIRECLDRSRSQIASVQHSFGSAVSARGDGFGAGVWQRYGTVPYLVVSYDGGDNRQPQFSLPDDRLVFKCNDAAMLIDQRELVALQRMVPVPPVPALPAFVENVLVSTAGVKSSRAKGRAYSVHIDAPGEPDSLAVDRRGAITVRRPPVQEFGSNGFEIQLHSRDSILLRMRDVLEQADESVRRADSLLQQVQRRFRSSTETRIKQTNTSIGAGGKDEETLPDE